MLIILENIFPSPRPGTSTRATPALLLQCESHLYGGVETAPLTTITGPVKIPESNDLCLSLSPLYLVPWCHSVLQSPSHCQTTCWCFAIFPHQPPPGLVTVVRWRHKQVQFHLETKYTSTCYPHHGTMVPSYTGCHVKLIKYLRIKDIL